MHRYSSYELWRSEETDGVVTTMIPSDHPQHDLLIEHGYQHVASILGNGWDDAMKNYNSLIDEGALDR